MYNMVVVVVVEINFKC